MSAPSRPTTTRGFLSVWAAPVPGPEMMVRTTFFARGRTAVGSCMIREDCVPEPFPRANEGRGEIAIVVSGWRCVSTTVVELQREQRNFTLGCAPRSASLSTCCVPQLLHAACMCCREHREGGNDGRLANGVLRWLSRRQTPAE